jgi:hypothetical protein
MADTVTSWRNYYELLGSGSATMIGLLFVAATVGGGAFSSDRRAPVRMFLSASVVHFTGILSVSLVVMAPLESQILFGTLIVAGGLFGLAYYGATWRDTVQDGLIKRIDLEDRIWYAFLPVVGYLLETASGVMLILGLASGWPTLAATMGMLVVIAIHNAWDITVWSMSRRRD